jgi:TRAP-type mannitol/chloroaromatic compound transport system permease large subunit
MTEVIAVAAFPYFLMMVVAVLAIWFFPELVTYLPSQMKL